MSATPPCSAPAYGGCSNTTTAPSSSSVLCQRHSTESGHDGGVGGSNADDHTAITHRAWLSEAHYQISKALPMAIAGTIRSLISIIELRALGHIGSAPLAGRSLSLLIVNLTGYPFMYGLGGALESLCIPCAVSGISSYGFSDLATIAVTALGAEGLAIQGVLNSLKSSLSRTGSYLGMVISTRVGNLLGANKPIRAHLSAKISALMTICATALLATIMLACKKQVAMFITKDKALVDGLLPIIPLLVVVVALDIVSNVLTGVLRGQGRQGIAAVIRVIALYGMAVPLSFLLCFTFGLGLYGLWIGLATGFVLISCAEAYLVFTSDWKKEAENSIERVNDSKHPALRPPVDSPLEENSPLLRQSTSV
ncbi:hypothetical protein GGI07_002207 [Coemansia sp. Benny D115]|nr:hypothetical protein GGI07_002207 [Coemansia sp. Benny D115]